MNPPDRVPNEVALMGLDGANPLGFLAALGTLVTLHGVGEPARLSWARRTAWVPSLHGTSATEPEELSELVARGLRGRAVPPEAEDQRARSVRRFDAAKKAVADKRKEIKKRGLRGAERQAAIEQEVAPLEQDCQAARQEWLAALSAAAPRPELALGKRLDCTPEEYRQHAEALLADSNPVESDALNMLAAFGTDACVNKKNEIEPTPFQFITGSGHQFFLATVRELMQQVTAERVQRTLFQTWTYPDDGLSMRWDPLEDRRYALMDRDPTASGNKPRTEWMANLLAYRGLALYPTAPRRGAVRVVAWVVENDEPAFTWPLWEHPASPDAIRSLLALQELRERRPDRETLRARGVAAAFRARRIKVGSGSNYKFNFTPPRAVV